MTRDITLEQFEPRWGPDVAALCSSLGWESFADPAIVTQSLLAPGVTAVVALAGDRVVGFAQVLSDGVVQAYLAQVAVGKKFRRQGIARQLVEAAFSACGARRLDLLTDDAHAFYRSFPHREKPGFRLYPCPPAESGES